jgi:transcriptional regulator with XRE-family HTH domain
MNVPIDVEAVRAKLIELGWTQAELAEEAKLSKRAVEGILSRGTATLESLHRIANALEMDVNDIQRVPSSTPSPPPGEGHEPLGEARLNPPDAAEVFIAYSSRDRDRVIEIANQLERVGVSCWLDREKIPGASNYGPEIVAAIKGCKVLLVCCSDASMRSKNIKQEIQLGWKYDRPYLPLLLEHVSYPEQVEYWLEGWQWVEALDSSVERWLPTLTAALVDAGVESAKAAYGQFGIASTMTPKAQSGLAGLRALAKFTDQIWPIPADKIVRQMTRGRLRGLGAPQEDVQRGHRLGSRVALVIEAETGGHLLLLDEGPEKILYCLCPSRFAPDTTLPIGRSYLPQPGSRYDAFVVSGKPGREHLVAIISKQPLVKGWLPADTRLPAKTLTEADVAQLLQTLQELPVTDWIALSTYFDVIA